MSDIQAIAVFCGSRDGLDPRHVDDARQLGQMLAERGIRLVYGGGGIGIMGELSRSAVAAGGAVTGIIPDFLTRREVGDLGHTETLVVRSMHERKQTMFELADGFVALPGGMGTLDETIEVVTWRQLGLHAKPVVVLDASGYWAPLRALTEHVVSGGFAGAETLDLFQVVDSVEAVIPALEAGVTVDAASVPADRL
jgi:uncharacterized protein (TIGR00730 family)